MHIQTAGKQIDVGEALQKQVSERLSHSVQKYFENAVDGSVVFSKESHLYRADVIVNEGTGSGIIIKGNGEDTDIYAAFDKAVDRIEKQLRRYKRKIKDHHKKRFNELDAAELEILDAKKYVLREGDGEDEAKEQEDNPLIIANKDVRIEKLTVSEAVMQMNLQNLPALLFINKANDNFNVVYHRKDGNISWVDPTNQGQEKSA